MKRKEKKTQRDPFVMGDEGLTPHNRAKSSKVIQSFRLI